MDPFFLLPGGKHLAVDLEEQTTSESLEQADKTTAS